MEHDEKKVQHVTTEEGKPKKSNKKLLYIAISCFLVLICAVGIYIFITSRSGSLPFPNPFKKSVLITKQPKLLTDISKSEKISAKKGGKISLTTPQGTNVFLYIPPGALQQDTTLTITPLEETPIEGFTEPDPGFVIGPPGIQFNPPAAVVIGGQPPAAGGQVPGQQAGQGANPGQGQGAGAAGEDLAFEIFNQAGIGNLTSIRQNSTPSPTETRENTPSMTQIQPVNRPYPDLSVILITTPDGYVQLIPTSRSGNGAIGGLIKQTGTVVPHYGYSNNSNQNSPNSENSNGNTQENEGVIADQAAANGGGSASGGACTPEYINALIAALNQAKASGDGSGASRYGNALKDCDNQSLDFLKRLCAGDRRLVRRAYFTQRIQAANMLAADDSGLAAKITQLEKECTALYRFSASGQTPGSGTGGVTMTSSMDATVCGYVDDVWKGNFNFDLTTSSILGFQNLSGSGQFQPPSNGGYFSGNFNFKSVSTGGIVVPIPNAEQTGYFDGQTNLEFMAYPAISLASPIQLVQNSCSNEPGLEPINSGQQGSDNDLIPLEPLVPKK